ncbi:MAG: sigma-54-dependent Fis family transcriptional regulator [Bacteroidia bacterium]|nr:sigma-54-dependent Fis family transcriptional regulator [Bacteroidia bacterium]
MGNILLVEDDIAFVQLIDNFLRRKGYTVITKMKLSDAIAEAQNTPFDLVLLDYHLPDGNAFDLIAKFREKGLKIPIIIMTGFNDVRTAVKAIHSGVLNYITKPINPEELLLLVSQALSPPLHSANISSIQKDYVKGKANASRMLNKHTELVASTDMAVMIVGESGTGKENIARTIHVNSKRASGPFVAIDCGALYDDLALSELFGHVKGAFTGAVHDKKGSFELANGGTLFLDEVGNLSYNIQVKLLRALQEYEIQPLGSNKIIKVNVRIITATNTDLKMAVKNGNFREDLYHRLNEFGISVPPLRERGEDLELFCEYFLKLSVAELGKKVTGISTEVMDLFKRYDWPGNLRELKNIIKRAVLLSTSQFIGLGDIPHEMQHSPDFTPKQSGNDLKLMNETNEKELIIKTLNKVKNNKSKAASLLNIDRKTLYIKLAKYCIEV